MFLCYNKYIEVKKNNSNIKGSETMLKNKIEEFHIKSNGYDNKYHGFYYTDDYILGHLVKGSTKQIIMNKIERISKMIDVYAESQTKHKEHIITNDYRLDCDDLPF